MSDNPNATSGSFHTFPQLTVQEKTDIKRVKGQISCAECRRLKLKCDKKLPCSSCVRRGCGSICPTGTLTNGSGKRAAVSDTTALHKKIEEMGQRIRQLEDALAIFQGSISTESHPLLRGDLLNIKFPSEIPVKAAPESRSESPHHMESVIDALGTLTLGENGHVRYLGRSAGTESLLTAAADMQPNPDAEESSYSFVSKEIAQLSNSFPFKLDGSQHWDVDESMKLLYPFLPPKPKAWSLCEAYLSNGGWSTRLIPRDEIVADLLTPMYKYLEELSNYPDSPSDDNDLRCPLSAHKLAVLFIMFAIGTLVDMTAPPYSVEAQSYFELGKACLSLRTVFSSPEDATIKGLALAAMYYNQGGPRYSPESAWSLMSLSVKLAQSAGLHSESPKWNLTKKMQHRRRSLFWELFTMDTFFCITLGRPPSITLSFVDCKFPEGPLDEDKFDACVSWSWKFTKEVAARVAAETLTPTVPDYELVLELDRKLRQYAYSPIHFDSTDNLSPSIVLRGCFIAPITMMHLHRSFFVQAILDHPTNPLSSPYAPSFLAAYRSASALIHMETKYFLKYPGLTSRHWSLYNSLFSAGVIVGSIVTRSPASSMAPKAFVELGLVVEVFSMVATESTRTRAGYAILKKLHAKATLVVSESQSGGYSPSRSSQSPPSASDGDALDSGDELEIFGGLSRMRMSKSPYNNRTKRKQGSGSSEMPSQCDSSHSWPTSASAAPDESYVVSPTNVSLTDGIFATTYGDNPFEQSVFSTMGEPNDWSANTFDGIYPPPNYLGGHGDIHVDAMEWDSAASSISMAGESAMDTQWLTFMQNEGILDNSGRINTNEY